MKLIPSNLPSELKYNCTYTVIVADLPGRTGGKYVYAPQKINLILNVDMIDSPVGEFSESVNKKIAKAKNSWLVKGAWLNDLFKVYQGLDKFCTITNTIQGTAAGISSVIAIAGAAIKLIPVCLSLIHISEPTRPY